MVNNYREDWEETNGPVFMCGSEFSLKGGNAETGLTDSRNTSLAFREYRNSFHFIQRFEDKLLIMFNKFYYNNILAYVCCLVFHLHNVNYNARLLVALNFNTGSIVPILAQIPAVEGPCKSKLLFVAC